MGAGGAGVGMGVSAIGNIQAGEDQAAAYEFNSSQLKLQAGEVERRNYINSAIEEKQGEQYISKQASAFSANGIDVSSSGSLDFLAEQHAKLNQQIELNRQQTVFETGQLRGQADNLSIMGDRAREAGKAKAVGNFMSFLGTAAGGGS